MATWAFGFDNDGQTIVKTKNDTFVNVSFVGPASAVMERVTEMARNDKNKRPLVYRDVATVESRKRRPDDDDGLLLSTKRTDHQANLLYDDRGLPFVTCTPHFGPSVRLYHFRQQTDPWYAIRTGLVTATAATTIAGLNMHETAWDYALQWLGVAKRPEDEASADIMLYGNTFEETNRACFCAVTGLQTAETGFVVDTARPRLGISPDGIVQNAKLTTATCTAYPKTTLPTEFETALALFEAKCSPFSLPKHFKVVYVGQTHAQMAITGLKYCWGSMWHQHQMRIVLIEFVRQLWEWMFFRIQVFLAICDRYGADEAPKRIRQCPLWNPDIAAATEADWYPKYARDHQFAARYSGRSAFDFDRDNDLVVWLEQLLPGWRETTPYHCLQLLPPRPLIHPVFCRLETDCDLDSRTDRGYIDRTAWPSTAPPTNLPRLGVTTGIERSGIILCCDPLEPLPAPLADYQPLYSNH